MHDGRPALILQNGPDDPPAHLADWLAQRGIDHVALCAFEQPLPADPGGFSFVVTLGSSYSVNATEPGWIPRQLDFLDRAVQDDVPVLGLCWGAQALSVVLGGRVTTAPRAEVGWIAIDSSDPEIAAGPWLHYHYDVFTVPSGAAEVARSPAGPAAFRAGHHLGVQFHPEATPEMGVAWARNDRNLTVSTPDVVAAEGARFGDQGRELAFRLFDAWGSRFGAVAADPPASLSAGTASTAPLRSPSG